MENQFGATWGESGLSFILMYVIRQLLAGIAAFYQCSPDSYKWEDQSCVVYLQLQR